MNDEPRGDHNARVDSAQGAETPVPTLRAVERGATARLRAAGIDSAGLDARILIGHAFGLERDQLLCRAEDAADAEAVARLENLLGRRLAREPVSRILGRREFWSLDFTLSPDTLDPRPDSETVVEAGLAAMVGRRDLAILDLGTGTGCLLLALLSEMPTAQGLGVDISAGAVATATGNAERLGLGDRARFERHDWREGLAGRLNPTRYDLVVANPPYICCGEIAGLQPEVARFDPPAALAGGADGLEAYRSLASQVAELLTPGGHVVFEVGAGQASAVAALLDGAGLSVCGTRTDLAGIERCVIARTNR